MHEPIVSLKDPVARLKAYIDRCDGRNAFADIRSLCIASCHDPIAGISMCMSVLESPVSRDEALAAVNMIYDMFGDFDGPECRARIYDEEISEIRRGEREQKTQDKGQFVYLLRCAGLTKIGMTRNPESRLKAYSAMPPYPKAFDLIVEVLDASRTERAMHKQYSHLRERGEWFRMDEQAFSDCSAALLSCGIQND